MITKTILATLFATIIATACFAGLALSFRMLPSPIFFVIKTVLLTGTIAYAATWVNKLWGKEITDLTPYAFSCALLYVLLGIGINLFFLSTSFDYRGLIVLAMLGFLSGTAGSIVAITYPYLRHRRRYR